MNGLHRAANKLKRSRWIQGQYTDFSDGYCAVGAYRAAIGRMNMYQDTPNLKLLAETITENYPSRERRKYLRRGWYTGLITEWNDMKTRKKEEVVAMLEKAAVKAEEKI